MKKSLILSLIALVCLLAVSLFVNVTHAADETWAIVSDANELSVGDQIVITDKAGTYAMSTTQNSSNRAAVAVSSSEGILTINSSVEIITLEQGSVDGTFAFKVSAGYLYAAGSSSNNLKTQTTNNVNGCWKISITNKKA